jgi:hypothetical protein
MDQKDSVLPAKNIADNALKDFREKIAIIRKRDFDAFAQRASTISDAVGCTVDIIK